VLYTKADEEQKNAPRIPRRTSACACWSARLPLKKPCDSQ
jgi:hypothetical protein